MTLTYRIRDWGNHFENNRTRELKELRFVIMPNKQDGDGYTELLDHPNGAAHYGAWCSLVQVASKGQHPAGGCGIPAGCCECRGILLRDGSRPHDPASLSRLTRIPAPIFEEALPRLINIGWLEVDEQQTQQVQVDREIPQKAVTIPHPPAEKRGVLKNGMEGNGSKGSAPRNGAKPRDPVLDNPAVVLYKKVCHLTPNHEQRRLIADRVTNLDTYEAVLRKFMQEGQPPNHVDWTLERYQKATTVTRPLTSADLDRMGV